MGVEALDPPPGAPYAPGRPRPVPSRWKRRVPLGRVAFVGSPEFCLVYGCRRGAHPAGCLEAVDGQLGSPAHQPVARRHGGAVVEDRAVADDDRFTLIVVQGYFERSPRPPAQ